MTKFKKILLVVILTILVIPASASAFWFFNKPDAKANAITISSAINSGEDLSESGKTIADSKYLLWENGFEKKNVDAVIANQNNYWFNVAEINYLFNSVNSKIKNPLLSNFKLTDNNGTLSVTADFKKIIKGNFSFNVQVVNNNNKIRLSISKLKFYGFPVPAAFISGPINGSLDESFAFLYNDSRYQGFNFSNDNGILKLKPEFK